MTLFIIIFSIYTLFQGAVYGRVDGGGVTGFKVNEWVERSLIMFFFVMACAPFAGWYALLAYAGVIGIAIGHGQYFLNLAIKYIGDTKERVDPFVSLFFGQDPRCTDLAKFSDKEGIGQDVEEYGFKKLYWRCVFGMFVTGTIVGIPACILSLFYGQYIIAFIFLLTGFAKAFAYMAGQFFWRSTEPAEYINGGLRNVICLIVTLLSFGAIING